MPKGERPPPDQPADALPGTPAKIAALAARAGAGRSLWHPLDRRQDGAGDDDEPVDLDALPWKQARYLVPHPGAP